MKIWMSFDMEGVAGIVDWDQCRPGGGARLRARLPADARRGQRRDRGRASPAVPTEIVLNDSHGTMANLDPRRDRRRRQLHRRAGTSRCYMMQGLDDTFDAVFFVGYHGSISGRPVDAVAHLQPRGVHRRPGQRRTRWGRAASTPWSPSTSACPIAFVSGDAVTWDGDRAVRAGRRHGGHQGVDHPVQRRATCTRPSPAG